MLNEVGMLHLLKTLLTIRVPVMNSFNPAKLTQALSHYRATWPAMQLAIKLARRVCEPSLHANPLWAELVFFTVRLLPTVSNWQAIDICDALQIQCDVPNRHNQRLAEELRQFIIGGEQIPPVVLPILCSALEVLERDLWVTIPHVLASEAVRRGCFASALQDMILTYSHSTHHYEMDMLRPA
jgi:hypothetical protein